MPTLNADALRRAMNQTRAGRVTSATALIQKTLGQHGLNTQSYTLDAPTLPPLQGFTHGPMTARQGRRATYQCTAGARDYILHIPESAPNGANGLVLMLHGCTQTPEDFATGTQMERHANTNGLILVYPAQSHGDNAQSCWNWFSGAHQRRDRGEPAILAGLAGEIAKKHGVPDDKVFAAGLSAGAAMAIILGHTYPDVFAGVAAHSGLPYARARGVAEAFAAMDGTLDSTRSRADCHPTPTIVFHGTSDATVKASNADRIIEDCFSAASGTQVQIVTDDEAGGRTYRQVTSLSHEGKPVAEQWTVQGLGHAWSGGNAHGSHTDARGPDASAEMIRFFLSLSTDEV